MIKNRYAGGVIPVEAAVEAALDALGYGDVGGDGGGTIWVQVGHPEYNGGEVTNPMIEAVVELTAGIVQGNDEVPLLPWWASIRRLPDGDGSAVVTPHTVTEQEMRDAVRDTEQRA